MVTKYRPVLSAPGFVLVLGTALFGRLPMAMSPLAVLLLIHGTTGSYALAGVAVGAYALATGVAAPVQGRCVDHFGRLLALAPLAVFQAMALLALVLSADAKADAVTLIGLSALAGAVLPPVAPAVRALIGEMFSDLAVRETAYTVDSIFQELIWIAGPLLVALAAEVSSTGSAVLLIGIVGLAGTLMFVALPAARRRGPAATRRPSDRSQRPSVRTFPELRYMLVPAGLIGLGLGAMQVGLPAIALHIGQRSASAVLLAMWSVGAVLGGLAYGARTWQSSLVTRYRVLLIGTVVLTVPLIFVHTLTAAVAGALVAGLPGTAVFACQYALVGQTIPQGFATEAFTWMSAIVVAGVAGGAALGGVMTADIGLAGPFALACAAYSMAAMSAYRAQPTPRGALSRA